MKEHDFIRQISENLAKGGLGTFFSQAEYGMKDRVRTPESVIRSMDKNMPLSFVCADNLDKAMNQSLRKFEDGEYTLPELIFRANCTGNARDILWKQLGASEAKIRGKFALVTIPGEKHIYGKDIVALLLKGVGFKIIDFGIAVPADKIIRYVKDHKPDYLGISTSTTSTIPELKKTVEKLSENKYLNNLKIIIGGYAVGAGFTKSINTNSKCGNIDQTIAFLKSL